MARTFLARKAELPFVQSWQRPVRVIEPSTRRLPTWPSARGTRGAFLRPRNGRINRENQFYVATFLEPNL